MADEITFVDDENSGRVLIVGADIPRSQLDALRYATPDDLARAGYVHTTDELRALRALYTYLTLQENDQWIAKLLKAVDAARKETMNITINLSEADLKQAIAHYLAQQGYAVERASFHVSKGDRPGEPDAVYASATVKKLAETQR